MAPGAKRVYGRDIKGEAMKLRQLLSPYTVDRRAALLRFHTRHVTLPARLANRQAA